MQNRMRIKIFKYIPELDCFDITPEFREISETLGLSEWNRVVDIGRFFCMDNDYGEHWFDNWDERQFLQDKAKKLGYESEFLYIINPDRFKDGKDGPCHSNEERKLFWTDVLKSLELDFDFLAQMATKNNPPRNDLFGDHIPNLKKKISELREKYIPKE